MQTVCACAATNVVGVRRVVTAWKGTIRDDSLTYTRRTQESQQQLDEYLTICNPQLCFAIGGRC